LLVLWLSVLDQDAVDASFACGLPPPPCVVVAVADCVAAVSPALLLLGPARADCAAADARAKATAMATVRLVVIETLLSNGI